MKNYFKLLVILFFITTLVGCKKDRAPKANYGFSFYLNDEFWTPQTDKESNWPFPDARLFDSEYCPAGCGVGKKIFGGFGITAVRILNKKNIYDVLYLDAIFTEEGMVLKSKTTINSVFYNYKRKCDLEHQSYYYNIDTTWTGHYFNIQEIDYHAHHIKGEFSFRLVLNEQCSEMRDTLYMTKGKMDVDIIKWNR